MSAMVHLPLLKDDECEDWVLTTLFLNGHWRKRRQEVPFYTLGLTAYLDCRDGSRSLYRDQAMLDANNHFLGSHFQALFDLVQAGMQRHFEEPVHLASQAAWPGFHIYQPHPVFAFPVAKIHRDTQYRDVFPEQVFADSDVYTFTLPLSNPDGSGLNWWPEEGGNPVFVPYRNGELVVHDGLQMHQAVLNCHSKLERITLQGHAVRKDGQLLLYW